MAGKKVFLGMIQTLGLVLILALPAVVPLPAQETEVLRERVSVVNIEMVFRVYQAGKPVSGLQKEDLALLVNGKPTPINGFFERRKKILSNEAGALTVSEAVVSQPRLFALIFNISDYQLDLQKALDHFFDKILRPNDRLMVLSNSLFQSDHVVSDPRAEKEKLQAWLKIELDRNRNIYLSFRQRLISLLRDTKQMLDDVQSEVRDPEEVRRIFIGDFRQYLKEYRQYFINYGTDQYIKLADYLRRQKAEKWVFNFFEINNFFVPKVNSTLEGFLSASEIYPELRRDLDVADNLKDADIGKYFINSGVTFHSLFMTHRNRMPVGIAESTDLELQRVKIASDTENVFARITQLTGGVQVDESSPDRFYRRVTEAEDIYYVLTYAPENASQEQQVKLQAKNRDWELVYDDQKRSGFIREILAEQRQEAGEVAINGLEYLEGVVRLKVMIQPQKQSDGPRRIGLHLQVMDKNQKSLIDKNRWFEATSPELPIQIKMATLPTGVYNLILEARDLGSGKNDVAFLEIKAEGGASADGRLPEAI